jgi:hypothetical protein
MPPGEKTRTMSNTPKGPTVKELETARQRLAEAEAALDERMAAMSSAQEAVAVAVYELNTARQAHRELWEALERHGLADAADQAR